ncbi:hypothetical protein OV090_27020 [Nannocystis sp. RBIL2]|uniref:hypothetical protein n=1 Tax=Nannocystis sp. RBIL2 TaxID=2996788 RepID=UPI00226E93E4|nr:hypothetical protein [Nannocystis sp. RBIL2]MCY1068424.1 hypothetical protein [Nannocystis sp. RBIL2]
MSAVVPVELIVLVIEPVVGSSAVVPAAESDELLPVVVVVTPPVAEVIGTVDPELVAPVADLEPRTLALSLSTGAWAPIPSSVWTRPQVQE